MANSYCRWYLLIDNYTIGAFEPGYMISYSCNSCRLQRPVTSIGLSDPIFTFTVNPDLPLLLIHRSWNISPEIMFYCQMLVIASSYPYILYISRFYRIISGFYRIYTGPATTTMKRGFSGIFCLSHDRLVLPHIIHILVYSCTRLHIGVCVRGWETKHPQLTPWLARLAYFNWAQVTSWLMPIWYSLFYYIFLYGCCYKFSFGSFFVGSIQQYTFSTFGNSSYRESFLKFPLYTFLWQ